MKHPLFLRAVTVAAMLATAGQGLTQIKLRSPTPSADANFGFSILVANGVVYVGAPTASAGGTQRGEVIAYDAATGAYRGRVRDSFGTDYARFGESLAIIGNLLYIGSPLRAGPSYGRVYYSALPILGENLSTQYLFAPDAASNENFGAAVGRFGTTPIVGAPDGPAGQAVGKVYASAALVSPIDMQSVAGARLGTAIAGSNQVLAVGSPQHPATGVQSGRIWIVGPGGTSGAYVPPGLPASSYFGASVSVSGSQILAGAPDYEPSTDQLNVGSVYLIDGISRRLVRQIQPAENFGRFGTSVTLYGGLGAAGASYSSTRASEGGAFYIFRTALPAGQTSVLFPIAPADLRASDHFGATISMDSRYIAIGAPDADIGGLGEAGAVYVYPLAAPPPVVKPKPRKAAASSSRVKISGSATGGFVAIARVEYALKYKGPYKALRGTTRWKDTVKIKHSTRRIFVRALDAADAASAIATIRVTHVSP